MQSVVFGHSDNVRDVPPEILYFMYVQSRKQGPSHRKVRRWRNEHFDDLASEMASDHGKAADALRKAKEKAHLYRDIVNFREMTDDALTRLAKDDKLQGVRDKFFECELPVQQQQQNRRDEKARHRQNLTAQEKLYRVDTRLRRVVTKACGNSLPAAMVVKTLETFVRATFGKHASKKHAVSVPAGQWWTTLLTEAPTVTKRRDGKLTVCFLFDAQSSSGGFHRLLLHAICQFHGLQAVSKMVDIEGRSNRALIVTGETEQYHCNKHALLDQLIDDAAQVDILEEPWTMAEPAKVCQEGEWALVQS